MAFRTGLLGKKLGMTSIFTATGDRAPVTAVHAGPCVVLDKITPDKHGYAAVKLGFGEKPLRRTKKPELGLFTKAKTNPQRFVREVRLEAADLDKFPEVGQPVPLATVFKAMSYIDVEGTSKGKGYQGVMKRHHMPGFRSTHGTHEFFRHGGSIGCRLTPQRVHKGKRMAGHMGAEEKTVQNLQLFKILGEENCILVRGAVPGANNDYVVVTKAATRTAYKRKGVGKEEVRSKNPLKASKKAAAGRG
jgi:large subunit ribosomal protein L3